MYIAITRDIQVTALPDFGPGVIGEQPVLHPGETFRYASGCPLTTPSGMMQGSYRMVTDSGESFDVEIPAFSLDSPLSKPTLN